MNRQDDYLRTDAQHVVADHIKAVRVHIPAEKAIVADPDAVLDGTKLPDAAGSVTEFLAQPPWPMNLTMICSGTQSGKATVHGLDFDDQPISEEFTLNGANSVVGNYAFKEITRIDLPIKVASETIDVGFGGEFGIPFRLRADELVFLKLFNNAVDAGTVVVDAEILAKNTYDPAGTLDGKKPVDLYILI